MDSILISITFAFIKNAAHSASQIQLTLKSRICEAVSPFSGFMDKLHDESVPSQLLAINVCFRIHQHTIFCLGLLSCSSMRGLYSRVLHIYHIQYHCFSNSIIVKTSLRNIPFNKHTFHVFVRPSFSKQITQK